MAARLGSSRTVSAFICDEKTSMLMDELSYFNRR
jgi:hypothetical protein